MKRSTLIFGAIIVLLGVVLLGINLGVVTSDVWRYFWPLVLVLLGIWFILGPYIWKADMDTVDRSIPLMNDLSAEVQIDYGAGRLNVSSSATVQDLMSGSFVGGITEEIHRNDGRVTLKIKPPAEVMFPGNWVRGHQGVNWDLKLTKEIPLKLHFHMGACETHLDLTELKVTELVIETGASSTDIQLPQNAGYTRVKVESGAADVKIHVPQGVAASIRESSALSGINVDTSRFLQNGHNYQSADYDTAANKVEISYEGGVGSVEVN